MTMKAKILIGVLASLAWSGCGDDGPRRGEASGCDAAVEANCPGLPDSGDEEDTGDPQFDVSEPDASDPEPDTDPEPDPDGTLYPLGPEFGVVDGRFDERLEAAFDGQIDQGVDAAAITPIYENLDDDPLLYKEFRCETRLRRLEVHAPEDGFFIYDETNFPAGGSGTVQVVGRRADNTHWYGVTSKPFDAESPVVFTPEELSNARDYVAYGVTFASDSPLVGEVQVAEVSLFGYCATPEHEIAWEATEWLCTGVECVNETNPGGVATRTVTCARDAGGFAHPEFCEGEEPASQGESCELRCPYTLTHVGGRPFTYSNESGWLHEGNVERRAGPLPSNVEHGTTVEAIEGKPCSILTENPLAYYVGISCTVPVEEGEERLYCAFRCE
ncbi:hypothetical protein FRC98_12970 [Lujinxingia vulgaris]|uniref:Lipoprotein n=1 Tax=Lujinxingia vulgaris TaxID=2600176 RepID=A0A5C6X8S6_9DELT|nr:hypothetical protein [Lujinxingia vulgaris]TXD36732.1 hypothetical protein FRC98_12970 [Lujinxingia vulgaris]